MVKRTLVGAHYGLRDWVVQRVTAVVMALYTVALIAVLLCVPHDYAGWREFFSHTWVRVFTQVTVIALLIHAWIGVRDIWMDYVKCPKMRLALHTATIFWLVACLVYSVNVIWGLA